MWIYEKKLEFPVKITKPDARLAKIMIEQYGGADGELGASLRYLSQKFTLTKDEILAAGLDPYYVNHGLGVYPSSAAGVPFTAAYLQSKGDPITDLYEDMAAEGAFA